MNVIKTESHPYRTRLILLAMALYPLLFIWQGLDVTDLGFNLVNYQQIFNEPSSIEYGYFNYLTNFIGGLWYLCFGGLGVLGFRIAAVLTVYLILLLAYQSIKDYGSKTQALFALLLTMLVVRKAGGASLLNYNLLTSLFFVLTGLSLYKGLCKDNKILILISGFTAGLSIFILLPNLLIGSIVIVVAFYGFICHKDFKTVFSQTVSFLAGYVGAVIFILLI